VAGFCGALALFWCFGCGRAETGAAGKAPETPKTITVEPVATPANLKPGLKLTTFPNNKFTGPGETTEETTTVGFPCDSNAYKDKEVSLRYQGYLRVDKDGTYVFRITSDDQCKLKLGSMIIVDNEDATRTKEGSAKLRAGLYPLVIDYQNNVGLACLDVTWTSESTGAGWAPVSAAQLLHD